MRRRMSVRIKINFHKNSFHQHSLSSLRFAKRKTVNHFHIRDPPSSDFWAPKCTRAKYLFFFFFFFLIKTFIGINGDDDNNENVDRQQRNEQSEWYTLGDWSWMDEVAWRRRCVLSQKHLISFICKNIWSHSFLCLSLPRPSNGLRANSAQELEQEMRWAVLGAI